MNTKALTIFVTKIMDITATPPGMGGASAGIFGNVGTGDPIVRQLRRQVMEFASEYRKDRQSGATLHASKEVEGLVSTLQVLSVITSEYSGALVADLYSLTDQDL